MENEATLLKSDAVQANAKTVPTCNATNVGGTDICPRMWKLCPLKLPRAVSRNHRPVDSPEKSKNCDFINNSTNATNDSLPEHAFAACLIDGVPVNALLDTGSMKSFIGDKVHNIFDFDCGRLDKSWSERCTSITGRDLILQEPYLRA